MGATDDLLRPPPPDAPLGQEFLAHFGLARREPDAAFLEAVARAFGNIPFENLTKIIKHHAEGSAEAAMRAPAEVFGDHRRFGAGGTCFSLTALFLFLLRSYGFEARPVLADRRYGPDTHCAALVALGGQTYLVDPGYLLFTPVPVGDSVERRIATPFNEIVLTPRGGGALDLATRQEGAEAYRLTFKLPGADAGEFIHAWRASFGWDMMRYPVLTGVREGTQRYLQRAHYQERGRRGLARRALRLDRLVDTIATEFGIAREIAAKALEITGRREKLDV